MFPSNVPMQAGFPRNWDGQIALDLVVQVVARVVVEEQALEPDPQQINRTASA